MDNTQTKSKRISPFVWVLMLGLAIFFIFYAIEPDRQEIPADQLPWNSTFDSQGHLHALGLVLGKDSAEKAMNLYENDYEVLIFSDKQEQKKTAEVQFPQARIATIRGALFLKLDVAPEALSAMYERGVETTLTSSGERQVTPSPEDLARLQNATFHKMTFIPRKNLNHRAIEMRFGAPESITPGEEAWVKTWHYPTKGLTVLVNEEGPEAFIYEAGTH